VGFGLSHGVWVETGVWESDAWCDSAVFGELKDCVESEEVCG